MPYYPDRKPASSGETPRNETHLNEKHLNDNQRNENQRNRTAAEKRNRLLRQRDTEVLRLNGDLTGTAGHHVDQQIPAVNVRQKFTHRGIKHIKVPPSKDAVDVLF